MKVMLNEGDIIWSGKDGGEGGGCDYHLVISNKDWIEKPLYGCWCPEEAVDFLHYLGINAHKSNSYDTGYAAPGCSWQFGEQKMTAHIHASYVFYTGQMGTNKELVKKFAVLQKPED